MHHGVSARNDGLGKIFIDRAGKKDVAFATLPVVVLAVLAALLYTPETSFIAAIAFYGLFGLGAYGLCLLAVRFLSKRFGGLTGDHFGAMTEVSEVIFLLAACVWFVGAGA
jgi:adenosylcobinamide-GDP ribazoletransferase